MYMYIMCAHACNIYIYILYIIIVWSNVAESCECGDLKEGYVF